MRTTVTLTDDVATAVEQRRRETGAGISQIINDLVRRGLAQPSAPRARFVQSASALGARVDLTNVADVLDLLDEA